MPDGGLEASLQAVADATTTYGPDHPATLRALGELADAQAALGDDAAAAATLRSTLAAWEALGPEGELDALQAGHVLGTVCFRRGDLDGARHAQEHVLAAMASTFGLDNDAGVQALGDLAATTMAMGRLEDALELQSTRAAVIVALEGPSSRRALQASSTAAATMRQLGDFTGALAIDSDVLDRAEAAQLDLRFRLDARRHLVADFAELKDWPSAARCLVEIFELGTAGLEESDDLRIYLEEYRLVFENLAIDVQRSKVSKGPVRILMRGGLLDGWTGRRR
jgi:hypothetical protein